MASKILYPDHDADEKSARRISDLLDRAMGNSNYDGLIAEIDFACQMFMPELVGTSHLDQRGAIICIDHVLRSMHATFQRERRSRRFPQAWMTDTAVDVILSAIDYLRETLPSDRSMTSYRNRRGDFMSALANAALDDTMRYAKHRDFYSELGRHVAAAVLEHEPKAINRWLAPANLDYKAVEQVALERLVYFIGVGTSGPVKIGIARDPEARLSNLQTAHHEKLVMLAITGGGRSREVEYHARFAAHRLHGEWFTRCPEIEAEIAHLNTPTPSPEIGIS